MYMLMFPPQSQCHHNLQSTDSQTILANWSEIVAIWYTINHPTILHTQWNPVPTAARRCHFVLRDVSCRQGWHLSTPRHPQAPQEWPYCRQAQCRRWFTMQWSIADLLTSSHPQMSASHLLRLQVCANQRSTPCISLAQRNPANCKTYIPKYRFWIYHQTSICLK